MAEQGDSFSAVAAGKQDGDSELDGISIEPSEAGSWRVAPTSGDAETDGFGDELGLSERLQSRQLHMSKPIKFLYLYGAASVLLGGAIFASSVVSFCVYRQFDSRYPVQFESKWINVLLIVSGLSAIVLARKRGATPTVAALVTSLLCIAVTLTTFLLHLVNLHFRRLDKRFHAATQNAEQASQSISMGNFNLIMVFCSAAACIVSTLLFRHVLHITGKNFGYTIRLDKHRLNLSMCGMAQIIGGLLITASWTGVELTFQGRSAESVGDLRTNELLSHGLVVACGGYLQMMAASKGSLPLFVGAALLNGASFVVLALFTSHPLTIVYYLINADDAVMMHAVVDPTVWLCLLLVLDYLCLLMLVLYSLIKFVHLAAGDSFSRIDRVLDKSARLFRLCSSLQVTVGLAFAVLDVVAIGRLYKAEFTPLPVFAVASGLFAYGASRMGSVMLAAVSIALCVLCAVFSLRDIALFVAYALFHPQSEEVSDDSKWTVVVHFALGFLSLCELVIAAVILLSFVGVLNTSVTCLVNKMHLRKTLRYLKLAAIVESVVSLTAVVLGAALVFSSEPFLRSFGDKALTTGALSLAAAVLSAVALNKCAVVALPAALTRLSAFVVVWQHLDLLAFYLHNHVETETASSALRAAAVAFACFVAYCLSCAVSLLLVAKLLEKSSFANVHFAGDNTSELLDMTAQMTDPFEVDAAFATTQ